MKNGIYVKIIDSTLVYFIPFSNVNFISEWGTLIEKQMDERFGEDSLKRYYSMKRRSYREEKIIKSDRWWMNGCVVDSEDWEWGTHMLKEMYDMVKTICVNAKDKGESLNCDFYLNKRDHPMLRKGLLEPYDFIHPSITNNFIDVKRSQMLRCNDEYPMAPIVSFFTDERFDDHPFPTSDDWRVATEVCFDNDKKNDRYNAKTIDPTIVNNDVEFEKWWNKKRNTAFFRGSATGGGVTIEDNQRLLLAYIDTKINDNILDAGVTSFNLRDKKIRDKDTMKFCNIKNLEQRYGIYKKRYVPMCEANEYKYHIYVDGHCAAARYTYHMKAGAVILKTDSLETTPGKKLWYFDRLIPFDFTKTMEENKDADHIRISSDFKHLYRLGGLNGLSNIIRFLRDNDKVCKLVAKNAMRFYNKELSTSAIVDYGTNLFKSFDFVNNFNHDQKILTTKNYDLVIPLDDDDDEEEEEETLSKEPKKENKLQKDEEPQKEYYLDLGDDEDEEDELFAEFSIDNIKRSLFSNMNINVGKNYMIDNAFNDISTSTDVTPPLTFTDVTPPLTFTDVTPPLINTPPLSPAEVTRTNIDVQPNDFIAIYIDSDDENECKLSSYNNCINDINDTQNTTQNLPKSHSMEDIYRDYRNYVNNMNGIVFNFHNKTNYIEDKVVNYASEVSVDNQNIQNIQTVQKVDIQNVDMLDVDMQDVQNIQNITKNVDETNYISTTQNDLINFNTDQTSLPQTSLPQTPLLQTPLPQIPPRSFFKKDCPPPLPPKLNFGTNPIPPPLPPRKIYQHIPNDQHISNDLVNIPQIDQTIPITQIIHPSNECTYLPTHFYDPSINVTNITPSNNYEYLPTHFYNDPSINVIPNVTNITPPNSYEYLPTYFYNDPYNATSQYNNTSQNFYTTDNSQRDYTCKVYGYRNDTIIPLPHVAVMTNYNLPNLSTYQNNVTIDNVDNIFTLNTMESGTDNIKNILSSINNKDECATSNVEKNTEDTTNINVKNPSGINVDDPSGINDVGGKYDIDETSDDVIYKDTPIENRCLKNVFDFECVIPMYPIKDVEDMSTYERHTCLKNKGGTEILSHPSQLPPDVNLDDYLDMVGYKDKDIEGHIDRFGQRDYEALFSKIIKDFKNRHPINLLMPTFKVVEVGFNAGHSANLILKLCKDNDVECKMISFDIMLHPYSAYAKLFIDERYRYRHTLISGDSTRQIPYYVETMKEEFDADLIFIDGGHTYEVAFADILNCKKLSKTNDEDPTIVVIDNIVPHRGVGKDVYKAYKFFVQEGYLEHDRHVEIGKDYVDGYCVCTYTSKRDVTKKYDVDINDVFNVIERKVKVWDLTKRFDEAKTAKEWNECRKVYLEMKREGLCDEYLEKTMKKTRKDVLMKKKHV
jgi:predicted O-methyltransferase YrrM